MAVERKFDIELTARNYSNSLNLTATGISTFDPGAWRGPRLLVPVAVEALVVTPRNAAGPWAQTKIEPVISAESEEVTMKVPEPFETFDNRPPGVHLLLALPDGLTKGTHDAPPEEEPPQETEVSSVEQPEAETNQATNFRLIPDRWLIVRLSPGATVKSKRRAAAWVIESEQTDATRRVTPLNVWTEDRSEANKKERWLTAVGTGDPAYAAYYDNVQNVLGFHDALAGVAAGPLTYVVMGWYSQPGDDPLHQPRTSGAWSALLDELGWTLGDTPESSMERLTQVAEEAKARAKKAGLETNYVGSSGVKFVLADKAVERLTRTPLQAPVRAVQTQESVRAVETKDTTSESRMLEFNSALTVFAEIGKNAFVSETNLFLQYWPRQMICHGMVYDVRWNNVGGSYNTADAGVPKSGSVGISVGNTGIEALSALTAERRGEVNLEKILSAFHYGLLPELDRPDGLAALETLLHSEDFGSKPGGFIVDTIEEGDLFPQAAKDESGGSEAGRKAGRKTVRADAKTDSSFLGGVTRFEGVGQYGIPTARVEKKFVVSNRGFNEILADNAWSVTPSAFERAQLRPRKSFPLRRSMPRYWYPNDPVILLNQSKRSYKHGEDGRFTQDNKLVCRLTGETIQSINPIIAHASGGGGAIRATITAADLSANTLDSGQIPDEARALYREALLLDETSAPVAGTTLLSKDDYLNSIAREGAATRHNLSSDIITEKVRVEQTMLWNQVVNPDVDAQALMAISGMEGRMPSKVAIEPWRAPWTPLHLDWEVEWFSSTRPVTDWELQEIDYELNPGVEAMAGAEMHTYQGRSLLTPGVAAVFSARLKKFLEDEPKGDDGQATATQEESLKEIIDALSEIDVLAASMGNFHGLLIGREEKHQVTPEGATEEVIPPTPPADPSGLFPTRAGHLRLKRLRIIDAFGQIYDFDRGALSQLTCAEDVRVEFDRSLIRLPPRIVQPSRLMFRLLSAASDAEEATKLKSPVCGWILPDHLDEALEVYDAEGVSQGQVQLEPDGRALEWQGVPGNPGPLGGQPKLENQHLQRMLGGLLAWGLRDNPSLDAEALNRESALSSLLRMIDATLWTIDPLGREGDEHLSVLIGRPLAVVRAQLSLETEDAPVTEELSRTPFVVRLGALTRLHDGLMGYFVNDDYSQFYPVHESIADQTRPSGPREGFLGAIRTVPGFYQSFGASSSVKPVEHPYINREPTVRIRPQQQILLTLVIDPRGAVHATSGILPRKRIELMREHVAAALDAMTMTFRIGPVLTDPETIRMPLPAEIRGGWSWVRRTGPSIWQESPIVNANQDALLSPTPAQIAEGWLKLSGSLKEKPEE